MSPKSKVSLAVVKRLPKYYRYLGLIADKGIIRVSSQELSDITGLTASQIRQDLNHFGGFGQQGYGYNVQELKQELEKIIGIDRDYRSIVIGFGNIGQAIFNYKPFHESGMEYVAIFDKGELVGQKFEGIPIRDISELEDFMREETAEIAVLSVPKEVAQETADILVQNGIKGIWNFAPLDLELPDEIILENVHLDESIYTLTYYMNNIDDYKGNR